MDTDIKEWLSGQLNGTKSDRSKIIRLGKALHVDDSTMGICMRVGNPLGFLLEEYSNHNEDDASVDDLITAMNKCGLDDVSNHLLSLMNRWTILYVVSFLLITCNVNTVYELRLIYFYPTCVFICITCFTANVLSFTIMYHTYYILLLIRSKKTFAVSIHVFTFDSFHKKTFMVQLLQAFIAFTCKNLPKLCSCEAIHENVSFSLQIISNIQYTGPFH